MPVPDPSVQSAAYPYAGAVVAALVLLPLLVGATLRVLFARRRGWLRPVLAALLGAALLAGAVWVDPCTLRVDANDVFWMAVLAAAGALAAWDGRLPAGRVVRLTLASAFVLAGLEAGARWLLPLPPFPASNQPAVQAFLKPSRTTLRYGMHHVGVYHETEARACSLAFPAPASVEVQARLAAAPAGPLRLLHAGASLVEAQQVGGPLGERPFVSRLARLLPGTAHVNAGVSGTGADLQALLIEQWTARERFAGVVLYLFLLNDLRFMGARYPCCGEQSVTEASVEGFGQRCGPDFYPGCWSQWLEGTGAAYLFRWATPFSALARTVVQRGENRRATAVHQGWQVARQWQALRLSLQSVRDLAARRGLPLAVVLLPERAALDATVKPFCPGCIGDGTLWREMRATFLPLAAELGLTVWDPFDALEQRALTEDARSWFVPSPPFSSNDVHFGDRGHELMGAWLAERLRAWPPVADALRGTPPPSVDSP